MHFLFSVAHAAQTTHTHTQDSYVKAHFKEAYVGALFGVANTIKTYKHWIEEMDPQMWDRMMRYRLKSDVDVEMLNEAMSTQLHVTESIWNPTKQDANGQQDVSLSVFVCALRTCA